MSDDDLTAKLIQESQFNTVLIYCNTDLANCLKGVENAIEVDSTSHKFLKELDK